MAKKPLQVSGLLEADETYLRQSQKGSRKMTRPYRGRGGKATPKGSARDLVPVLIGRVRGTHQVSDSVLTAMTAWPCRGCPAAGGRPGYPAVHRRQRRVADRSRQVGRHVRVDSRGLRGSRQRGRLSRPDGQQLPRAVGSRPGLTVSCAACRPSTCPTTWRGCVCGSGSRRASSPNTSSFRASGSSLSTSRLLLELVPQRFGERSGRSR